MCFSVDCEAVADLSFCSDIEDSDGDGGMTGGAVI